MTATAGGRGRLRASHADREHVIDALKAAFVQGRLAQDELEMRVGQAFASQTYGELAALTADIPAGTVSAQPPPKPARAQGRRPRTKTVRSGAFAVIAAAIAILAVMAGGHGGSNADTQACQAFFGWENPVTPSTLSLNVIVATARQGSDTNLVGDLEALQQAVWRYENPGQGWQSGAAQELGQNQVAAAATQVNADCIPYIN